MGIISKLSNLINDSKIKSQLESLNKMLGTTLSYFKINDEIEFLKTIPIGKTKNYEKRYLHFSSITSLWLKGLILEHSDAVLLNKVKKVSNDDLRQSFDLFVNLLNDYLVQIKVFKKKRNYGGNKKEIDDFYHDTFDNKKSSGGSFGGGGGGGSSSSAYKPNVIPTPINTNLNNPQNLINSNPQVQKALDEVKEKERVLDKEIEEEVLKKINTLYDNFIKDYKGSEYVKQLLQDNTKLKKQYEKLLKDSEYTEEKNKDERRIDPRYRYDMLEYHRRIMEIERQRIEQERRKLEDLKGTGKNYYELFLFKLFFDYLFTIGGEVGSQIKKGAQTLVNNFIGVKKDSVGGGKTNSEDISLKEIQDKITKENLICDKELLREQEYQREKEMIDSKFTPNLKESMEVDLPKIDEVEKVFNDKDFVKDVDVNKSLTLETPNGEIEKHREPLSNIDLSKEFDNRQSISSVREEAPPAISKEEVEIVRNK